MTAGRSDGAAPATTVAILSRSSEIMTPSPQHLALWALVREHPSTGEASSFPVPPVDDLGEVSIGTAEQCSCAQLTEHLAQRFRVGVRRHAIEQPANALVVCR